MKQTRKSSVKRSAIREALYASKEHPSAEMLYEQLKPHYTDLSLGTVYRNLSMFCDDGSAVVVGTVDGKDRYDGDTSSHTHFICRKCGRIADISFSFSVDGFLAETEKKYGFQAEKASLTLSGLCDQCR